MKQIITLLLILVAFSVTPATFAQKYDYDKVVYSRDLHNKAVAGDAEAQCALGICYEYGRGVEENINAAVLWYKKSAEQGCAAGQTDLAMCYLDGKGVPQDEDLAIKWLEKAAEQGYWIAQQTLITVSRYSGTTDLQKAAKTGDPKAQYELGKYYMTFMAVPYYEEAVEWFTKAAKQGHEQAQMELAQIYFDHYEDYTSAAYWFLNAANQDNIVAQYNMGVLYFHGAGISKDLRASKYWLKKAMANGHPKAQQLLQELFPEEASAGLDKTLVSQAKAGNATAQYKLGLCYYEGKGVTQNKQTAIEWWKKSAINGNAQAQFSLGAEYYYGGNVTKNYKEAVKWFKKAAIKGHKGAQYMLSKCYRNGQGVPRDISKANYWDKKSNQ